MIAAIGVGGVYLVIAATGYALGLRLGAALAWPIAIGALLSARGDAGVSAWRARYARGDR